MKCYVHIKLLRAAAAETNVARIFNMFQKNSVFSAKETFMSVRQENSKLATH